jgi:hypothetical protein
MNVCYFHTKIKTFYEENKIIIHLFPHKS